jgi:hypothetical protein
MKTIHRALTLVAVLALLSPLAILAQSNRQGPYHDIEIQVKDLNSDQVIGTIQPGGSFTLREGQRVRLIMTAIHPGRGRGIAYPETEFTESEPGRGWVRVTRTNVENANATLEIQRPSNLNRNRTETLHYRIVENIGIPSNLRQGSITIHAVPDLGVGAGSAPTTSYSRAQQLTNTLYRAILLRDMDPSGQPYVDRIASGGYTELIRVAEEMAGSEESRDDAFDRAGGSIEQRLNALYQNLLGLTSSQVDSSQRSTDAQRLRAGQIDDVVAAIVQSTRFQEYQNLSDWMAVRY